MRDPAPSGLCVRPAGPEDCRPAARATAENVLFARYGTSAEALEARLHEALERSEGVLVAEAAEPAGPRLLGFAWFLERGTFGTGGYLRLIAVAPDVQSRGVGRALLEEVERRVAVTSRTLFLLVSHFNLPAQRFYAARGYAEAGRLKAFVRPDIDELVFWKRLV